MAFNINWITPDILFGIQDSNKIETAVSTTRSGGRTNVNKHTQLKQCLTTQTYRTNNISMGCDMRQSKTKIRFGNNY